MTENTQPAANQARDGSTSASSSDGGGGGGFGSFWSQLSSAISTVATAAAPTTATENTDRSATATSAAPAATTTSGLGAIGSGFAGLVDTVRKQSAATLKTYKEDLDEFGRVMKAESSRTLTQLNTFADKIANIEPPSSSAAEASQRELRSTDNEEQQQQDVGFGAPFRRLTEGSSVSNKSGVQLANELRTKAVNFGNVLSAFLNDVVNIEEPSPAQADDDDDGPIKDLNPPAAVSTTAVDRTQAMIETLTHDEGTFTSRDSEDHPLELIPGANNVLSYASFILSPAASSAAKSNEEKEAILADDSQLKSIYEKVVVNGQVTEDEFWSRFSYVAELVQAFVDNRRNLLRKAAEAAETAKRASAEIDAQDSSGDFGWDEDDASLGSIEEDANKAKQADTKPQQAAASASAPAKAGEDEAEDWGWE